MKEVSVLIKLRLHLVVIIITILVGIFLLIASIYKLVINTNNIWQDRILPVVVMLISVLMLNEITLSVVFDEDAFYINSWMKKTVIDYLSIISITQMGFPFPYINVAYRKDLKHTSVFILPLNDNKILIDIIKGHNSQVLVHKL